jgi:hypothetical protein
MTEPANDLPTYTSQFDPQRKVQLDPYGVNPLEVDMAGSPAYAPAKASGIPVPKLFQNGADDLPAFTASGLDPKLLLKLPYGMRHAVAAEPSIEVVHAYFERDGNNPDALVPHEGLTAAQQRVSRWASTAGVAASNEAAQREDYINAHVNTLKGIPENLRRDVLNRAFGRT